MPPPLVERLENQSRNEKLTRAEKGKIGGLISLALEPDLSERIQADLEHAVAHLEELGNWLLSMLQPHERIRHLREAANQLGLAESSQVVSGWSKRLIWSVQSLSRERPHVLCAFTLVKDRIRHLDQGELDRFLKWAADELDTTVDNLLRQAMERRPVPKNCRDLVDVVAVLLNVFRNSGTSLKPYLETDPVRQAMWRYFSGQGTQELLGGAAAIQAETLGQLLPKVETYFYYPPASDMASPSANIYNAQLREDQWQSGPLFDQEAHQWPLRQSCIFAITPNRDPGSEEGGQGANSPRVILADGTSIHAHDAERVIFGVRRHSGSPRCWKRVEIWKDGTRLEDHVLSAEMMADEWPAFPLFGEILADGETLVFDIANEGTVQQIAERYDCILLNGLRALTDSGLSPEARECLNRELGVQLCTLRSCNPNLRIHTELGAAPTANMMDVIAQTITAGIRSAGVNAGELQQITSLQGSRFFVWPQPSQPETLFERYWRGNHLLTQLEGLDWLYVHGSEIDIELRRCIDEADLAREIEALLLAKAVVVLRVLERSGISYEEVRGKLAAVLAEKGHLALIEFSYDFARHEAKEDRVRFKEIFRSLVHKGYWLRPDDSAVLAVPVMWPLAAAEANTAGAGDITSGVTAVFSRG